MIDICYGQQLSCVLLRALVPCADFVVRLRSVNLGTQQFPTPASTAGRCCCFPTQRCQHFCVAFQAWFLEPELVGGASKAGRQAELPGNSDAVLHTSTHSAFAPAKRNLPVLPWVPKCPRVVDGRDGLPVLPFAWSTSPSERFQSRPFLHT